MTKVFFNLLDLSRKGSLIKFQHFNAPFVLILPDVGKGGMGARGLAACMSHNMSQ